VYVPAVSGQTSYSYTLNGMDSAKDYNFVIKAVGTRNNSLAVEAGLQRILNKQNDYPKYTLVKRH
jgi:hypothetical protein